jgi:hypothetical protein
MFTLRKQKNAINLLSPGQLAYLAFVINQVLLFSFTTGIK